MYLDLVSSDSYNSYNIKIAHVFGLKTAVYWSEIINIARKAINKKKLDDDGYFKVDRKYIFNQTTLTTEDQYEIDKKLASVGVTGIKSADPDQISLDIPLMVSLTTNDDLDLLTSISKKATIKSKKETQISKRSIIIQNIKNSIVEPNETVKEALINWVDTMFAGTKGYLSKKQLEIFQTTLNNYANTDINLKLKIIEIAIVHSYRDCQWAINVYEKDKQIRPRTTIQVQANMSTIDKNQVF